MFLNVFMKKLIKAVLKTSSAFMTFQTRMENIFLRASFILVRSIDDVIYQPGRNKCLRNRYLIQGLVSLKNAMSVCSHFILHYFFVVLQKSFKWTMILIKGKMQRERDQKDEGISQKKKACLNKRHSSRASVGQMTQAALSCAR